jgi:hypothetical protein
MINFAIKLISVVNGINVNGIKKSASEHMCTSLHSGWITAEFDARTGPL